MSNVIALSLTYCPDGFDIPPAMPWRVSTLTDEATSKIVAYFYSEEAAAQFIYFKPFYSSGIMAVPAKWRYLFEDALNETRQHGIECARLAKRMYAADETTLND